MRTSKYTLEVLAPLVQGARSFADVLRALGLPPTGGNYRMIAARIRIASIDATHLRTRQHSLAARCAALSAAEITGIVPECTSIAQLATRLGLAGEGRAHREPSQRVRELAIDTSHFRGRGWSRGETAATHPSVARVQQRLRWSDAQVFVENSAYLDCEGLKRRLRALGVPYACAWCGLIEWRGGAIVLHLDHINGINNDHRRSNLRFLCDLCRARHNTHHDGSRLMPGGLEWGLARRGWGAWLARHDQRPSRNARSLSGGL